MRSEPRFRQKNQNPGTTTLYSSYYYMYSTYTRKSCGSRVCIIFAETCLRGCMHSFSMLHCKSYVLAYRWFSVSGGRGGGRTRTVVVSCGTSTTIRQQGRSDAVHVAITPKSRFRTWRTGYVRIRGGDTVKRVVSPCTYNSVFSEISYCAARMGRQEERMHTLDVCVRVYLYYCNNSMYTQKYTWSAVPIFPYVHK